MTTPTLHAIVSRALAAIALKAMPSLRNSPAGCAPDCGGVCSECRREVEMLMAETYDVTAGGS